TGTEAVHERGRLMARKTSGKRNTSKFANQDRTIANEKADAARELAKKHYEVEAGLTRIFRFTGKAEVENVRTEPIKLLEVNENTVPSGVMPLHFGPAP